MSRLTEYLEATFETWEERIERLRREAEGGGVTESGGSGPGIYAQGASPTPPPTLDLPFVGQLNPIDPEAYQQAWEQHLIQSQSSEEDIPLPEIGSNTSAGSRKRTLLIDALEAGLIDNDAFLEQMGALAVAYPDLGIDEAEINLITALVDHGRAQGLLEEAPELGLGTKLDAFKSGVRDEAWLRQSLAESGYEAGDIGVLVDLAIKEKGPPKLKMFADPFGEMAAANERKEQQSRGGFSGSGGQEGGGFASSEGGGASQKSSPMNTRVIGTTGGGGQTRPQPRQVLNDFRTAFSQNLKSQQTGLSLPARKWAMENMDFFLDDYLGSAGVGAVNAPVFTKGAAEIQTLYEGTKGTSQAARRSGQGTAQVRNI